MATSDHEGLSILYRIGWRIRYIGWHLFGPAQTMGPGDPHWRLEEERRAKVAAARAARESRITRDES